MAQDLESEKAQLLKLQETAPEGLFTQQFGEFLAGKVPPLHLFQFLAGQGVLPEDAYRQFLQLEQTFRTQVPGIQEVSFAPLKQGQTMALAIENLWTTTHYFHSRMQLDAETNKYSITVSCPDETVESITHNLPFRHPSHFSAAVEDYLATLPPATPPERSFATRRAHTNFMRAKPFVRIIVENKVLTHMTIGYGLLPKRESQQTPTPLPQR